MRTPALVMLALLFSGPAGAVTLELSDPVVMRAAAVGESSQGFVGSTATITITTARNGSGHVFLDTFPLTEVDMQGSARLAARVAAQISGRDLQRSDVFFVVRSGSEQIGGPSAGATMTVGAIAALNGWKVRDDVLMTGTVSPDATVGPVGGIAEKATAAAQVGITRFLFPAGQETVPLGAERMVNLTSYCRDELRIECIPVRDVIEAVNLMTDHVIERPPLNGNVTGDDYLARLAPLSAKLVDDAAIIAAEAQAAFASVPEGQSRAVLAGQLDAALALLSRARNETANGSYYTAASTSFQSSIETHYVREASRYLVAADRPAALAQSLAEARATVTRIGAEVSSARVQDTNTFETVGAAQVRQIEAEERLAAATALAQQPRNAQDFFDALHAAAFAAERAETAAWWLSLSEGFAKGTPVEAAALLEIAHDTLTTSREEVAYVDAVFRSGGATSALDRSRSLLRSAESAMARNMPAGAMLLALEASVRASVLLETVGFGGDVPDSKFETAREEAARAIQGARARGAESLLAQSAYEFGLTLPSPVDKLTFLGVARVTGNLAGLPGLFGGASETASRFQANAPAFRIDPIYVVAAFAVGVALGVGAGLSALMPKKDEPKLPPTGSDEQGSEMWGDPPRSPAWPPRP